MMAGLSSWIWTVAHLLSNLPLVLWINLGWAGSASWDSVPGTQPRSAMSWQPLHTPKLKVSGLWAHPVSQTSCLVNVVHLSTFAADGEIVQ